MHSLPPPQSDELLLAHAASPRGPDSNLLERPCWRGPSKLWMSR
jgi:hypothetical protein